MEFLPLDAVLTQAEVEQLHKDFANSGLVELMNLLKFNRKFVSAEGCNLWAEGDDQPFLDFLGGYGALNLGHNHPVIAEALKLVAQKPNILQAYLNPFLGILAHNLAQVAPGNLQRIFPCNSGAEAVEGAIKFARASTGRTIILSIEGAFHGKTMGALSLTGKRSYQEPFDPMLPDCEVIPFGNLYELTSRLAKRNVAGFIVEPVLGEGGIKLHPEGYLKEAQSLCKKYGTLLIADEIQTGLGRTGKLFASEHFGLEPDIMCLAKSLGGGYIPIGVTMTTDAVWQKSLGGPLKCLRHTSTFGGNTLACAAGIASLQEIVSQDLSKQATEKGGYLTSKLQEIQQDFPFIKEVRGLGLLIGLEFDSGGLIGRAAYELIGSMIAGELLKRHILVAYTLNNPTVVRIEPPLIVEYVQLDTLCVALRDVLTNNPSLNKLVTHSGLSAAKNLISGLFSR